MDIIQWIGGQIAARKAATCPHCRARIDASNLRAIRESAQWNYDEDMQWYYDEDDYYDEDEDEGEEGYDEEEVSLASSALR